MVNPDYRIELFAACEVCGECDRLHGGLCRRCTRLAMVMVKCLGRGVGWVPRPGEEDIARRIAARLAVASAT